MSLVAAMAKLKCKIYYLWPTHMYNNNSEIHSIVCMDKMYTEIVWKETNIWIINKLKYMEGRYGDSKSQLDWPSSNALKIWHFS